MPPKALGRLLVLLSEDCARRGEPTLAAIALIVCLYAIVRVARALRSWIADDWGKRIESLHAGRFGERVWRRTL